MATRTLEIKTRGDELQHTLPLTNADGETLTLDQLQTTAASLLPDAKVFSLCYTDSDGDQVAIVSDADVKELNKYMEDEQLQSLEVLAVTPEPVANAGRAAAVQTQLRGLVTAMSKLTAKPETTPTPASAMNLLVATLQAMDVAGGAEELATVKKELLLVLQDEAFRQSVDELSATEQFKDLADAVVAAIYAEDAQAIEDAVTARFDELLVFAQRLTARCPSLKPAMVSVAKSLVAGLVRYNDEDVGGNTSDASRCSSSSSSSCSSGQETVNVEVLAEEVPVHVGVACDGCAKAPLVGTRYKSLDVRNFDVCEDCEASGEYTRCEPFIKITSPSRAPKQKRASELPAHPCVTCGGCGMAPITGVRFRSQTKDDFDLCEACEASGKWTETHGPFTKVERPATAHAFKFTCRRGGRSGKCGRHHGHGRHGEFGRCHGRFGPHEDDEHHHGKFGHHGRHHGPPGFDFHGPPGFEFHGHHGPPGFPGHGFPFPNGCGPDFSEGGRPDLRGRHGYGFGPPGCFGGFCRFGPPPFEFMDPRGPPMCPRGFEHGGPPFPADFERFGGHGHHGNRHGCHTRFSDNDKDDKQDEAWQHHGHHGCHGRGRGRCGRYATDGAQGAGDAASRTEVVADEGMEIIDSAEAPMDGEAVNADAERKDFSDELTQLAAMGFNDIEKNVHALELAHGNIGFATNVLLSE